MADTEFHDLIVPAIRVLDRPRVPLADGTHLIFTDEPMFDCMAVFVVMRHATEESGRVDAAQDFLTRATDTGQKTKLANALKHPDVSGLHGPGCISLASRLLDYYLNLSGGGTGSVEAEDTRPTSGSGSSRGSRAGGRSGKSDSPARASGGAKQRAASRSTKDS